VKDSVNKYYAFKVWAATLICGSFLSIFLNIVREPESFELSYLLAGPPLLALGGAFVSLPAFAIYYCTYRILHKKIHSGIYLKFILCPLSIVGLLTTIYFFVSKDMLQPSNRDGFLFTLSYVFCVVLAGILFKIFKEEKLSAILSFEKQG